MALSMKVLNEKIEAQQKQINELLEAQADANKTITEMVKLAEDQLKTKEKLTDTVETLTKNMASAMHYIDSLNITTVGLAYTVKANPKRVNAATPEKFLDFVEKNIHPLIRRSDELATAITDQAKKDIAKTVKEETKDED